MSSFVAFTKLVSCFDSHKIGKINHLPHMPILGSSNLAANKDIMANIWTNADTII